MILPKTRATPNDIPIEINVFTISPRHEHKINSTENKDVILSLLNQFF